MIPDPLTMGGIFLINKLSKDLENKKDDQVSLIEEDDQNMKMADGGRIGLKGGADASQFNVKRSEQKTPNVSAGGASFEDLGPSPRGDDYDRNRQVRLETLKEEGVPEINAPGLLGLGLNATKKLRDFTLKKNVDYFQDLNTTKYPKTAVTCFAKSCPKS